MYTYITEIFNTSQITLVESYNWSLLSVRSQKIIRFGTLYSLNKLNMAFKNKIVTFPKMPYAFPWLTIPDLQGSVKRGKGYAWYHIYKIYTFLDTTAISSTEEIRQS